MMRQSPVVRFTFRSTVLAAACAVFLLAACADYETPAKDKLAEVTASLDNVARDAAKYAPDELKAVKDELDAAKASFDKGDYEKALLGARAVAEKVPELATTAGKKKNELMKQLGEEWQKLSVDLPKTLDSIGARITKLGKSKTKPAGFDQAKTDYDAAKQTLGEATAAGSAGNVEEAVAKAKTVQEKATAIMAALGMKAPG
jgi:hypothetical protein